MNARVKTEDIILRVERRLIDLLKRIDVVSDRDLEIESCLIISSIMQEKWYRSLVKEEKDLVSSYLVSIIMILHGGNLLEPGAGEEADPSVVAKMIGHDVFEPVNAG